MKTLSTSLTLLLSTLSFAVFAGESVNQRMTVQDVSIVNIENMRGKVKILGIDTAEVAVTGELDDKAEGFIFEQQGKQLQIKVEMPHHHNDSWHDEGSNLVITLPQDIKVSFNGVSTDVEIRNLNNSSSVHTVSGQILAEQLSNKVEISSVSGDIKSRELNGKISLTTVSGDIDDNDSSGRIKLKAVSGNIDARTAATEVNASVISGEARLKLSQVDELKLSVVSGDAEVSLALASNGDVKLSSVSGDLTLAIAEPLDASFKLGTSAGGRIVNKITNDKPSKAKYGPSSKLSFAQGNGSATVKATTVSGSITVK